jgi:signal peptidase I
VSEVGGLAASHSEAASPSEPGRRPASAAIAVALSLTLPGLGHAYAGPTARAMVWVATSALMGLFLAVSVRLGTGESVAFGLCALMNTVGLRAAAAIDVARWVRRFHRPRTPARQAALWAMGVIAANIAYRPAMLGVVEAFLIPSGSMVPTLIVGDHIMIGKLRRAARGDVIAFPFPEHPDQMFVKRIVGMPGDHILFREGHPVVNGVEVPSCRVGPLRYEDFDGTEHEGDVYLETLDERPYLTFFDRRSSMFPGDQGPYVVAEDQVFVVGDNRWNAHDSRMWYGGRGGGVPIDTIAGVPFTVWLSTDAKGIRRSRIGLDLRRPRLPDSMSTLRPALEACLAR